MKRIHYLLLVIAIHGLSLGQESSNVANVLPVPGSVTREASNSLVSVRPLGRISDSAWQAMTAARSKPPLCALAITNDVSQDVILKIADDVNGRHKIDQYVDGLCGTGGARLSRDYVGAGFLVTLVFDWDNKAKKTTFSLYGGSVAGGRTWKLDMRRSLSERFDEPGQLRQQ